jgi:hypothetical protein
MDMNRGDAMSLSDLASDGMVERVAEKLWRAESLRASDRDRSIPWSEAPDDIRSGWRFMARAAIEAMREPTEAMIRAAFTAPDAHMASDPKDLQRIEWRAMINAALAEPPTTQPGAKGQL